MVDEAVAKREKEDACVAQPEATGRPPIDLDTSLRISWHCQKEYALKPSFKVVFLDVLLSRTVKGVMWAGNRKRR